MSVGKIKKFVKDNHDVLVTKAEGFLKGWHGRPGAPGSVLYQLNDQDHFDSLFDDAGFSDDELIEMAEAGENACGDMDIWIEAAKNLGFDDYVADLERARDEGI